MRKTRKYFLLTSATAALLATLAYTSPIGHTPSSSPTSSNSNSNTKQHHGFVEPNAKLKGGAKGAKGGAETVTAKAKVLILGAGASGVATAKKLVDQGITDFIILESRDVIGGRMQNVAWPPSPDGKGALASIELGANWIQGVGGSEQNPFMDLVDKYGMSKVRSNFDDLTAYSSSGPFNPTLSHHMFDTFHKIWEKVESYSSSRREQNLPDMDLRAALKINGWDVYNPPVPSDYDATMDLTSTGAGEKYRVALREAAKKGRLAEFIDEQRRRKEGGEGMKDSLVALAQVVEYSVFDFEMAEPADGSSLEYAADIQTYKKFGDDQAFIADPRGFKYILEQELESAFQKAGTTTKQPPPSSSSSSSLPQLILDTTVSSITYASPTNQDLGHVLVHTDDGRVYQADYVVTTFSLGVLQHGDVEFNPPLPSWKVESLHRFHLSVYTKIFLNFPNQFWDDEEFVYYGDDRRGYYPVWMN
ncbi:hypothetical protein HK102_010121, partial [Quaeritorhiza haematococci]